jgi:Type IV Pilus-assembly protein W
VRVWLLVRAEDREVGFTDDRTYNIANRAAYSPDDDFRRVLVVKTIMLRNARR